MEVWTAIFRHLQDKGKEREFVEDGK